MRKGAASPPSPPLLAVTAASPPAEVGGQDPSYCPSVLPQNHVANGKHICFRILACPTNWDLYCLYRTSKKVRPTKTQKLKVRWTNNIWPVTEMRMHSLGWGKINLNTCLNFMCKAGRIIFFFHFHLKICWKWTFWINIILLPQFCKSDYSIQFVNKT